MFRFFDTAGKREKKKAIPIGMTFSYLWSLHHVDTILQLNTMQHLSVVSVVCGYCQKHSIGQFFSGVAKQGIYFIFTEPHIINMYSQGVDIV